MDNNTLEEGKIYTKNEFVKMLNSIPQRFVKILSKNREELTPMIESYDIKGLLTYFENYNG